MRVFSGVKIGFLSDSNTFSPDLFTQPNPNQPKTSFMPQLSTFSRARWLNSLHMAALTLALTQEQGIDDHLLLEGSGISLADLKQMSRLVQPWQEQHIFANAQRLSAQPALGLALGLRTRITAYGLLGYALLSAPTFGRALRIALDYPVLLGTYFHLELEEAGELIWLSATGYSEEPQLRAFNSELCLASLQVICADLLGRPLPIERLELNYSRPPKSQNAYRNAFACRALFNQQRCGFAFNKAWLKQPLPLANPVTHQEAMELCQKQNTEYTEHRAWLEQLRTVLAKDLSAPPSLPALAAHMNCSSRSLRRHLAAQHSSYQALLDELRFTQAKHWLKHSNLSIQQIAERLGFSEAASFRSAFKRWSGQTPKAFR